MRRLAAAATALAAVLSSLTSAQDPAAEGELAEGGNATSAAEEAAAAAAAAAAARPPEMTEMEMARSAAAGLPTARRLSGRDLKGPPQYAGRRMWNDPLEVNLRAFFEGLGGPEWLRRDGWILTGEPPPPPPPPEFNQTADLVNTTVALFSQCNATELAMPMPSDLESWEFVATVPETPAHPPIRIHLDTLGPEVEGDSIVIRFPLTRWLLQDNYTQPWWNGETEVASMPWWETEGNGTQMDEWSSRRTEFYLNMMRYILRNESDVNITAFEQSWLSQDLAEDFYLHDVFCDSTITNCTGVDTYGEEFAAVLYPNNFEEPTRRVIVFAGTSEDAVTEARTNRGCCQESEEVNICANDEYPDGVCTVLHEKSIGCIDGFWNPAAQYSQGFCVNGIVLPVAGVESCDPKVAVRNTAYGGSYEIEIGEDQITLVRTDDPVNWDDSIDFGCVAGPVITETRAEELLQLRKTLHSDLSDVERWCFKDLDRCSISIEQETVWRTETVNISDANATSADPEPEPDDGLVEDAEGGRRLAEADPLVDPLDEEGEATEDAEEEESRSNRTMTLYIPVGKVVNISLNITGGTLDTFDSSADVLEDDMELMRAIFPRMYQAVRHMVRPETFVPRPETTSAAEVDRTRHDVPEPEPLVEVNETDTSVPEPEPEPIQAVVEEEEVDPWADASVISIPRYISVGLTDMLMETEQEYLRYVHEVEEVTCTWVLEEKDTFCANRQTVGTGMTAEECGAAVLVQSPSQYPQTDPITRQVVMKGGTFPGDPKLGCSHEFFSDGNSCQCVPWGEECVRAESMSGNDLFRHECILPTDKISIMESLDIELTNFCAFYQLQERLLRAEVMPEIAIPPRCDDGEMNGDEEKVDCGGSCDACPPEITSVCRERWFGTHCEAGVMVRLDLSANNLVGRMDSVLHLLPQTLRFLDLRENTIRGPIPPSIGRLDAVRYVDLSTNRLTGVFPGELEQLKELVHLSAHSNGLAGDVPVDALAQLRKLTYLNLKHNSLRGKGEDLPIETLRQLRYVNLRHNLLDGGLPKMNASLVSPALVHLDLAENKLDAEIPEWWFNSSLSLRYISLEGNSVPGEIPPSIGFPSKFYHIDLSRNQLSGPIPSTIGELGELRYLNLKGNTLQGEIPESIGGLVGLHYLVLAENAISGTLPSNLGALHDLHTLDLERNRFSGLIPDSLDVVRHNVIELNLGYNLLNNYIPPGICEENACNVCRGAGVCDQDVAACTCADGATGAFCEEVDQAGFAQLMFNNREFFDTSMWQVDEANYTNTSAAAGLNTTAANATAPGG